MTISGKIEIKPFALGSKSEHDTVYIHTDSGSYVLQEEHENPFEKSSLYGLAGKTVIAEGELDKYLFIARTIKNVE